MSLSAHRVPPRPAASTALPGAPTIIVTRQSRATLARRSRVDPDALFADSTANRLARNGAVVETTRLIVAFVVALAARPGAVLPTAELFDLLYGERADGGPSSGSGSVDTLAYRAAPVLAALGYRVETKGYRGRWLRCCLSPTPSIELEIRHGSH